MTNEKVPLRLAYWSMKGGVGRSTLLSQHAFSLAQLGFKVLAVDMDIEAPSLDVLFGTIQFTDKGNQNKNNRPEGLETILFNLWDTLEPEKREELLAPAKKPTYKSKLKEMTLNLVDELDSEIRKKILVKFLFLRRRIKQQGLTLLKSFMKWLKDVLIISKNRVENYGYSQLNVI